MSSDLLNKARKYERECGDKIKKEERPMFHITPTVGWLNDPNGFSIYKGEYHLFYQYYPYDVNWGPMHWGHVKSCDFVKWERLPAALAPDKEYDETGCFSGSAVELKDGRHLLLYTGVKGVDNTPSCRQTQCIAYGDGVEYEKYEGNPVLTWEDIPEGNSPVDFRDPKVWWDAKDETYYAVVGNRTGDGSGAILLFSSMDTMHWEYITTLDSSKNEYGKMWECPDLFQLEDTAVLLVSPQEMRAKGLDFHNGNDVICLLGSYEKKTHAFIRKKVLPLDYGLDFYAPQTLQTEDGRRIMIAWMQSWETSRFHMEGAKWFGMMSFPRELTIKDGAVIQNPVRELEKYRCNGVMYTGVRIQNRVEIPEIYGRTVDMEIQVRSSIVGDIFEEFKINIAENQDYSTSIFYHPYTNRVGIDRTNSGFRYNIVNKREAPVREQDGNIKLRILLDRFSVEIFVNDGEQVLSACLYTPLEADRISFEVRGDAWMDIEKYEILVP